MQTKIATLTENVVNMIKQMEHQIEERTGEKVILIAYEDQS